MRVQSLRPELEFEVIKLILLRESYIQRLQRSLTANKGKVDLSIIGLVDVLRDVSLEVIETIREWERSQIDYPTIIKPFMWNGVEYLIKMADDYGFLHAFPNMTAWLGFMPNYNPFFVPPEAYEDTTVLADNSFIVFGTRPPVPVDEVKKAAKAKFVKSPYNTPVLNDLNIFPELSALNRIKKELKTAAADQTANSKGPDVVKAPGNMTDPYESYVSAAVIKRAKACWALLDQSTYRTNTTTSIAAAASLASSLAMSKAPAAGHLLHDAGFSTIKDLGCSPSVHFQGSRLEEASFEFTGGAVGILPLQSIKETDDHSFITHGALSPMSNDLPVPPHSNMRKQVASASVVVSAPGLGELDGSFSRISATSIFSKTRDEFSTTSLGFHASLADTSRSQPLPNEAMRLEALSQMSGSGTVELAGHTRGNSIFSHESAAKSSVKTWTPHDVQLQKTVQRRGGELFVLTAASTKGRIKAPWRKTRFQRLEHDLEKLTLQGSMVSMAEEESKSKVADIASGIQERVREYVAINPSSVSEEKERGPALHDLNEGVRDKVVDPKLQELLRAKEAELRSLSEVNKGIALNKELLTYQLNHFRKLVDGGNVLDLKTLRERHKLGEGEALERENLISMSVEDRAASMITRTMKIAFGRAIRRMIIRKMNEAALKIQGFIRKIRMQGSAFDRTARLAVARRLQKIWRGRGGRDHYLQVKRAFLERWACQTFQRLGRGFLARRKTHRKRLFIRAVYSAADCVTLDDITPDDVESLADTIENFLKDYTENLPMAVMTILRGILYMFVGDEDESVLIENQGFFEVRRFQAKTVTWFGLKQILRRKGKFLRRLRALVGYINFPGPCALPFSRTCQIHLDEVREHIHEHHFFGMEDKPRQTCETLLRYIKHMKTAFDFQSEFPEYFVPATPNWYRLCLRYQYAYRRAEAHHNIALAAKQRIDDIREEYKTNGRRWGHVRSAEVKNLEEIEQTKVAVEKALEAYDLYIKRFVNEEKHDILLLEGIERARVLGLEVAKRDFKDYLNRNGDGDDKKVAMLRLQVDKKALSLLDVQVKLIKMKEMKEINLKARDFQRLMKLKRNRKICENCGTLLGRMMVLQEVWKDFLLKIGGEQYILDLQGKRKAIFDNLQKEIQELIAGRRKLNEEIDNELRVQVDRCRQISHNARVERTKLYWDNPTSLERESEIMEDKECSLRDADFEAKAARQARLVKIPPGIRRPVLLIIDIRTPKVLRKALIKKLLAIKFAEVKGYISDPTLVLPSQKLLDEGYNLVAFVDRGIHSTARAAFLGYFNAYINSLVPFPRIVALDASLQLRYENWFSEFSPDINELFNFNVNESASCGLKLGRLRRTAMMFKMCLLNETEEEDHAEGVSVVITLALRTLFRRDLDDFMEEIAGDRDGEDAMSAMSSMEKAGMILIATISSIMGIWKAPLLMWKEKQIQDGCNAFCERIQDAPKLCEMLWLNPLPNCGMINMKRLEQARTLVPVWRSICKLNFYKNPARYLLARWCLETMELMDSLAQHGGGIDEQFKFLPISHVRHLSWVEDVCDPDTRAEQLVGDLLQASLSESQVFDAPGEVCEYERLDSIEDTSRQYFRSETHTRRCRVYYSGSDCYLMVTLDSTTRDNRRGHRGERKESRNFVAHMDILDVITMLQPNFTEIFEGRLTKYIIAGPKKKHDWWELLATWGRLEKVGKTRNMTLLRSRYLMNSSLGYLNGYRCRFEVFEERYAEVLILIHGLPGIPTFYYRASKSEIARLLMHCDEDEEKSKLENMDAQAIASIFSDRLTARPSRIKNLFLAEGELQPKSLEKHVEVYLRVTGGPGRYVARSLLKLREDLHLIVTIFEITNPSDIYGLRVVLYEMQHHQTAEFRISPLERSSLFSNDFKLVDQLMARLRIVYTDYSDPFRCLLPIEQSYRPKISQNDVMVEGTTEYDIYSGSELLEVKRRGGFMAAANFLSGDRTVVSDEDQSQVTPELFKADLGVSLSEPSKLDSLGKWGWCLYFNRLFVEESRGNLTISGGLELAKQGFSFTVMDNRTHRESYRFLHYKEALKFLKGNKTEAQFIDDLRNIEQATVYDLVDELLGCIDVLPVSEIDGNDISEFDVHRLCILKKDQQQDRDESQVSEDKHYYTLTYTRLREVLEDMTPERAAALAAKFSIKKVACYVLAARNLLPIGGIVTARNPFAIMKWNNREAGRTTPARNDLNPEWDDPPIITSTTKDKQLQQCVLDIEVWDWNISQAQNADFLGCVQLSSERLISFFNSRELLTLPLIKSNRMTDNENKNVGGTVVLFGLLDGDIGNVAIPQDYRDDSEAIEKARLAAVENEKQRLAAEKKAASKGNSIMGMGLFSSKKSKAAVPTADTGVAKTKHVTINPVEEISPRIVPPQTKFSERHKVAEPEQYGPLSSESPSKTSVVLESDHQKAADMEEQEVDIFDAGEEGDGSVVSGQESYDAEGMMGDDLMSQSQSVITAATALQNNDLYSLADRTVTDDSMTLAGFTESRHITLELISAEGLPMSLVGSKILCLVKFNGFVAHRVEGIARDQRSIQGSPTKDPSQNELNGGSPGREDDPSVVSFGTSVESRRKAITSVDNMERHRREDSAGLLVFSGSSSLLDLYVPPLFELASCAIEIEFWDSVNVNGSVASSAFDGVCLGRTDIRGSRLVSFIESRGHQSSWLPLYHASDGTAASNLNRFRDLIPLRVQVKGDSPAPSLPKIMRIDLSIRSVRGLILGVSSESAKVSEEASDAGSDTGSKNRDEGRNKGRKPPSSLYVEVRFNENLIGTTPPQPDSYDPYPIWAESGGGGNVFEIIVPDEMKPAQCKLEFRLFSVFAPPAKKGKKKKKGKVTFRGSKILEGQALCNFLDGIPVESGPMVGALDIPSSIIGRGDGLDEGTLNSPSSLGHGRDDEEGGDRWDAKLSSPRTLNSRLVSPRSMISGLASPRSLISGLDLSPRSLTSDVQFGDPAAGIMTENKTMLFSLHPCAQFEGSEESKMIIADNSEMRDTMLEIGAVVRFIEQEDWEMTNDGLADELPVLPPETEGMGALAFTSEAAMRDRIGGLGGYTAALPNTTITGSVVERPWSRLSRASLRRGDIPAGQRANAMADVQDMAETRLYLTLHQIRLIASSLRPGTAMPKEVVARVFFNDRYWTELPVRVDNLNSKQTQPSMQPSVQQGIKPSNMSNMSILSARGSPETSASEDDERGTEEDYQSRNVLSLGPLQIVLFVPRGQRLDACTLQVEVVHKGKLIGLVVLEKEELVRAMIPREPEQGNMEAVAGSAVLSTMQSSLDSISSSPSASLVMKSKQGSMQASIVIEPPAIAPSATEPIPMQKLAEAPIVLIKGAKPTVMGTLSFGGSMAPLDSAMLEGGGALLQLGTAMHRRGAEETVRRVEVKLLAAQGMCGSLKVMASPRTGYGVSSVPNLTERSVMSGSVMSGNSATAAASMGLKNTMPPLSDRKEHQDTFESNPSGLSVYAVVKWNGQEIRRSEKVGFGDDILFTHHSPHQGSNPVGQLSMNTFVMFVPRGHRLRGCYLEITLWNDKTCLGSMLLHGEDLMSFLEGYGSARHDADFYIPYDPDDDTFVAHRVYPLQYSSSVPQSLQGPVNGRLVLRGRVDPDPDPLETTLVKSRGTSHKAYRKIRTQLPPETVGWTLHFDEADGHAIGGAGMEIGAKLTSGSVSRAAPNLMIGSALDQASLDNALSDVRFHESSIGSVSQMPGLLGSFQPSLIRKSRMFLTKFRIQYPAVTYRKAQSKNSGEDRVCWRGRGMPAEVKGISEEAKKTMFKNRSSRLIRKGTINELRVTANVSYLEEVSGQTEALQAALPILVKEVVSDGPGISERVYRIEITTNAGASLGFADIASDEDIIRAVGAENAAIFGPKGRSEWQLPEIFSHIVNNRTTLDFAPPKRRGKEASKGFGLGDMLKKSAKPVESAPLSVINIIKDVHVDEALVRYALHGGEFGGMTIAEQEAKARADVELAVAQKKRAKFEQELELRKKKTLDVELKAAEDDLASRPSDMHGGLVKTKGIDKTVVEEFRRDEAKEKAERDKAAAKRRSDRKRRKEEKVKKMEEFKAAEEKLQVKKAADALAATTKVSSVEQAAKPDSTAISADDVPRVFKEQSLRIHNCLHNMSGIRFRTVVLLQANVKDLYEDPDRFFNTQGLAEQHELLAQCNISIRAKDASTFKVYVIELSGHELVSWIGNTYQYDLRRKYRRMLFGQFLVSKMVMRFDSSGGYIIDVMSDDMGSAKSEAAMKEKFLQIREEAERKAREWEDEMAAALEEELALERLRRAAAEYVSDSDSDSNQEEATATYTFSSAGDAAAAAAKAAKDAMVKAAADAKAALGKMFTWGKKS